MSKQTQRISFVAVVTRILPIGIGFLLGMPAAEAKLCSAAGEPLNPKQHWSYRLIDGRKCWYEGDNNFPKALLQWPEQTRALSAFGRAEPSPEEELSPPVPQAARAPAEPNNQLDPESFEARWRALGPTPVRN
jgi:hypothetical protein